MVRRVGALIAAMLLVVVGCGTSSDRDDAFAATVRRAVQQGNAFDAGVVERRHDPNAGELVVRWHVVFTDREHWTATVDDSNTQNRTVGERFVRTPGHFDQVLPKMIFPTDLFTAEQLRDLAGRLSTDQQVAALQRLEDSGLLVPRDDTIPLASDVAPGSNNDPLPVFRGYGNPSEKLFSRGSTKVAGDQLTITDRDDRIVFDSTGRPLRSESLTDDGKVDATYEVTRFQKV